MKKNLFLFIISLTLIAVSSKSFSQAQLQLVHNCADPNAIAFDIYIDGTLKYDDMYFLTGTPMDTVNSGVPVNVGIAPSTSVSVNDTIKNFELTFNVNEKYVAIISGVLVPANFAPNPDAMNTGLSLIIRDNAQELSANGVDVDFCFAHGATDLAQSDVIARLFGPMLNDAFYGSMTGYSTMAPINYTSDITPYNDNDSITATYAVDFSTMGGLAATMFISGFVDPTANQNGPSLGLYAALSNGSIIQFPTASLARLQAIQNCADPLLDSIDIYMFGTLVFPDFKFRTATTFLSVPAGIPLTLGIAPGNSTSENDTVKAVTLQFENGKTYIGFASGVIDTSAFASNPDGLDVSFTMIKGEGYREKALNPTDIDFVIEHGVTDADSGSLKIHNGAMLFQNASYGKVSGYTSLPASDYFMDILDASGTTVLGTVEADFSTHAGQSCAIYFSGFSDSTQNQNGHSASFYASFPDGTTIPLPFVTLTSFQMIQNAADPAAALVDVYKNGNLWLNDFAFQSATPFMDIPATKDLNIGVALSTSTSANDTLKNFTINYAAGLYSVGILTGVLNPANFAVNPDGHATDLTLYTETNLHRMAVNPGEVDFVTQHGVTDAPTADLIARGVSTVGNDASYGSFTPYASLTAADYLFDITDATGSLIYYTFNANLSTYANAAGVVFASGFVDPGANQNGVALGLFMALVDGTVIPFTNTTSVEELSNDDVAVYPNPASDLLNISLKNNNNGIITINDVLGNQIESINVKNTSNIKIDLTNYSKGMYFVTLQTQDKKLVKKIVVE